MVGLRFQNLLVIGLFAFCGSMAFDQAGAVKVSPSKVDLQRPEGTQQIVVYDTDSTGRVLDITRKVSLLIDPPNIAVVDERGLISPLENGTGTIVIQATAERTTIPITVRLLDNPVPISFRREIIPILTKAGCYSGGCHGKAEGQNGFKLSIFGFDTQADFEALVLEGRGRRISADAPASSLLFLKASARTPHGGGQRIEPGSYRDHRLLRWIAEAARFDAVNDPASEIVGIEIEPQQQILLGGETQQIQARTIDASGNRRCVTNETEFVSNAAV